MLGAESGAPIPFAVVSIAAAAVGDGFVPPRSARCDAFGTARLRLVAGRYRFTVQEPDGEAGSAEVRVAEGEQVILLTAAQPLP